MSSVRLSGAARSPELAAGRPCKIGEKNYLDQFDFSVRNLAAETFAMTIRPRTARKMKLKARRCPKCGCKLNPLRKRCKKCAQKL